MTAKFPKRPIEIFPDQANTSVDALREAGINTLFDLDALLTKTAESRKKLQDAVVEESWKKDGNLPTAVVEAGLALVLSAENWKELLPWRPDTAERIERFLKTQARPGRRDHTAKLSRSGPRAEG
jgi:hypothetical protein